MCGPTAARPGRAGQQIPNELDAGRIAADQERFLTLLQAEGLDVRRYESAFSPYPFGVTAGQVAGLRALQGSVRRALVAVVTHYDRDARIRRVIDLPAAERDLLAAVAGTPYRVGSFRPDFLHAADGRAVVTEINARFTLNGYLSSVLASRCVPRMDPGLAAMPALEGLIPALRDRLGDGPVGVLKASEAGWDVHLLRSLWGGRCEIIAPRELTAGHLARWGGVVLELHQHELLDEVPAALRASLMTHPGVLNDPRSILIGHDKRLLALLSTSDVLADYLEADDLARLRRHVVPTWVKGQAADVVGEALTRPAGWLAKPPRGGKGQGIVVSRQLSPADWRRTLHGMPDDWVLQPYVEQQSFPVAVVRGGELVTVPMQVVGLLPALDDHAFGPGLYRAAADDVVNVARGGIILAPALIGGAP